MSKMTSSEPREQAQQELPTEPTDIDLDLPTDEEPKADLIPKFKVNYWFLVLYILSIGCNGICVAWTTGGNNQTASIFAAKLGWDAAETRWNNSLINFAS